MKLNWSAIVSTLLVAVLISSSAPLMSFANAQTTQTVSPYTGNSNQRMPTQNEILQTTLSGPVFLNAYFTDLGQSSSSSSASSTPSSSSTSSSSSAPARKQVGPGDGAATLAVVVVDRGLSDITAITGHLTLPDGFRPNGASSGSNMADATYNSVITAGSTFTLYFDVYVTDKATVGEYTGNLDVEYSQIGSVGSASHSQMSVPFLLSGRVILDTLTLTHNITPGVANDVNFQLINRGSAPATGTVVSITGLSTSGTTSSSGSSVNINGGSDQRVTNFGARTFSVGTIPPNSSVTLTASLFPSNNAGGSTTSVSLQLAYNDPYGSTQTLNPTLSLFVLPSGPSLISVLGGSNGNSTDNRVVAGKVGEFDLLVSNRGSSPITDAVVSLSSGDTSLQILGDTKWTVNSLSGQSSVLLPTRIYASPSLIGTPVSFSVTIDYLTDGQSKTEQFTIGTYVDGDINLSTYGMTLSYVGGTPTLTGNILNKGNTVALFTTVQLVQVQDLNGTTIGRFRQAGQQGGGFGSSSNQNGLQGQFGGTQQTPQSGQGQTPQSGQSGQAQQFGQGTFGGTNSSQSVGGRGGFRGSQAAQPQYLGDVTADSPIPFSITLDSLRNATASPLRVTLLVTYSDGLRNPHQMTVTQLVFPQANTNFSLRSQSGGGAFAFLGPLSEYGLLIMTAIVVAAAAIAAVVIISRRRKAQRLKASMGMSDTVEDILEEHTSESKGQQRVKSRDDQIR